MEAEAGLMNVNPIGTKERFAWLKKPWTRKLYDAAFVLGFVCCLLSGAFQNLSSVFSIAVLVCAAIDFRDENFYLYMALFIYLRYRLMLTADIPAFRIYRYMIALRFLLDMPKLKFNAAYLPALLVFFLHSVFAMIPFVGVKEGLNVIVDCIIVYVLMCRLARDSGLMRKFFFVFLLGGVVSGVYGWASDAFTTDINVAGAGAHKVSRNFGALSDANFAGMFYTLCIICTLTLKKIPLLLRLAFLGLFGVMILQTASLSALLTLSILLVLLIILKYRKKAFFILAFAFVGVILISAILLSIPQFRQLDAIAGLLIRFNEKLAYLTQGRWELLTTGRSGIWETAMAIFSNKALWGQIIGGSVVTVDFIDETVFSMACHNSYIQSILNFGILGALFIYIPLFAVFFVKLLRHFSAEPGYEDEDLGMLKIIFPFTFIVFGMTVDFFVDWTFMMLYFI